VAKEELWQEGILQVISCVCVLLQGGKTEYKSVTVAEDSTAEEFMDFYLDDPTRTKWVRTSWLPVGDLWGWFVIVQ
jgi:hypothetical protein